MAVCVKHRKVWFTHGICLAVMTYVFLFRNLFPHIHYSFLLGLHRRSGMRPGRRSCSRSSLPSCAWAALIGCAECVFYLSLSLFYHTSSALAPAIARKWAHSASCHVVHTGSSPCKLLLKRANACEKVGRAKAKLL